MMDYYVILLPFVVVSLLFAVRMGFRMGRESMGYSQEDNSQDDSQPIELTSDPWEDAVLRNPSLKEDVK